MPAPQTETALPQRSDPTTPGTQPSPTAGGSAIVTALAGTPLAILTVLLVQSYLPHGQTLDPATATAIGSVGASIAGYLAQVARALLQLLQEKTQERP